MKTIDRAFKDKTTDIKSKYKLYAKVNTWLVRFTSEPLKVVDEIENQSTELFGLLESVIAGLNNETLKTKAIEIGIKVISGYSKKIHKTLIEDIKFIMDKDNNPINVVSENSTLVYKDVHSEQLINFVKHINSSLAMKEYAVAKIENMLSPIISEGSVQVNYKVWLTRLIEGFKTLNTTVPSKSLKMIEELKLLDTYVSKKVDLIKTNLQNKLLVIEEPEGDLNIDTEVVVEKLDLTLNDIIIGDDETESDPLKAIQTLVEVLNNSISDFDSLNNDKNKVMLKSTILTKDLNLINTKTLDYVKGDFLEEEYDKFIVEMYNLNTVVIERLEKFTSGLINESIKLNLAVNIFMRLNILLEKILTETAIK